MTTFSVAPLSFFVSYKPIAQLFPQRFMIVCIPKIVSNSYFLVIAMFPAFECKKNLRWNWLVESINNWIQIIKSQIRMENSQNVISHHFNFSNIISMLWAWRMMSKFLRNEVETFWFRVLFGTHKIYIFFSLKSKMMFGRSVFTALQPPASIATSNCFFWLQHMQIFLYLINLQSVVISPHRPFRILNWTS